MIETDNNELQNVFQQVASWPVQDRIVLARKILASVEQNPIAVQRGYSAEETIAILDLPQPAPTDAECQTIIEQLRNRKYGG